MLEEGRVVTVRMLLKGLYEKACQQKLWGLVRHTAGMLGKRVEDLAKAVVSKRYFFFVEKVYFVAIASDNNLTQNCFYIINFQLPQLHSKIEIFPRPIFSSDKNK